MAYQTTAYHQASGTCTRACALRRTTPHTLIGACMPACMHSLMRACRRASRSAWSAAGSPKDATACPAFDDVWREEPSQWSPLAPRRAGRELRGVDPSVGRGVRVARVASERSDASLPEGLLKRRRHLPPRLPLTARLMVTMTSGDPDGDGVDGAVPLPSLPWPMSSPSAKFSPGQGPLPGGCAEPREGLLKTKRFAYPAYPAAHVRPRISHRVRCAMSCCHVSCFHAMPYHTISRHIIIASHQTNNSHHATRMPRTAPLAVRTRTEPMPLSVSAPRPSLRPHPILYTIYSKASYIVALTIYRGATRRARVVFFRVVQNIAGHRVL